MGGIYRENCEKQTSERWKVEESQRGGVKNDYLLGD